MKKKWKNPLRNSSLLLIGLGNPGERYSKTRHNAGFLVLDALAKKYQLKFRKKWFHPYLFAEKNDSEGRILLVKPLTFMNRSGDILPGLLKREKCSVQDLVVIYDNIDLAPGKLRLKIGRSDGGHNGLKSITAHLGMPGYMRLAVGVGRPENRDQVVDHVLGRPEGQEAERIDDAVRRAVENLSGYARGEAIEKLRQSLNSP